MTDFAIVYVYRIVGNTVLITDGFVSTYKRFYEFIVAGNITKFGEELAAMDDQDMVNSKEDASKNSS
jgi:hypothetical protein